MSVLAGWQRGAALPERLVWVAVGAVLVISAHLLPALSRSAPLSVRATACVLWLGCMAATSYGHATFFILAQAHAGEVRGSAVPKVTLPAHRELSTVLADRAQVVTQLAEANARRRIRDCPTLRVVRASLAARLDALEAEAADVRRYRSIEDRSDDDRDSVRDDPVTARLAVLSGIANARLDLLAGLAFAAVLEGTACLLWWLALQPKPEPVPATAKRKRSASVTVETPAGPPPAQSRPVMALNDPVTKLRSDIDAGLVKPTVTGIRQYLGCSQAKAAALRKAVLALP